MGLFSGILTFLVFVFNFLLFLIALFLIYVGLFSTYPIISADAPVGDTTYSVISNVILSVSIFLAVLVFTGCYGVANDNKLYLLIYSTTLLILIAIQVFLAIGLHDKLDLVKGSIGAQFTEVVKNQTIKENSSHDFMHELQRKYNCCGFESYEDWLKVLSHIPGSCCGKANNQHCEKSQVAKKPSCSLIIKKRSEELFQPIKTFLIIVFGIEVFLAASTICVVISGQK